MYRFACTYNSDYFAKFNKISCTQHFVESVYIILLTGEANFEMDHTSLTVGGFTQSAVARSLIELPSNIEKGLSTRFLWVFPEPCYTKFQELEPVDPVFTTSLGWLCLEYHACTYIVITFSLSYSWFVYKTMAFEEKANSPVYHSQPM